jgi:hypothetical protein
MFLNISTATGIASIQLQKHFNFCQLFLFRKGRSRLREIRCFVVVVVVVVVLSLFFIGF